MISTLRISLKCLIIGFPVPILFALLINRVRYRRFQKAVQTITYIPNFISTVVLVSMMSIFFAPNGVFNVIVKAIGIQETITYANGEQFDLIFVLSGIWHKLTVLLDGTAVTAWLDDAYALSARMYEYQQKRIIPFVSDGAVTFRKLTVRPLKEAEA